MSKKWETFSHPFTLDKKTVLFCFPHLLPDMSHTMEVTGYHNEAEMIKSSWNLIVHLCVWRNKNKSYKQGFAPLCFWKSSCSQRCVRSEVCSVAAVTIERPRCKGKSPPCSLHASAKPANKRRVSKPQRSWDSSKFKLWLICYRCTWTQLRFSSPRFRHNALQKGAVACSMQGLQKGELPDV